MKRLFLLAFVSASLAGCATAPPDATANQAISQDANGIPINPHTHAAPRTSVGVGIGSFGGRGFGGIGIGLGF